MRTACALVCSPRPLKWILVMCKVNVSPLGTKTLHDPKITKNPQKLYWNQKRSMTEITQEFAQGMMQIAEV